MKKIPVEQIAKTDAVCFSEGVTAYSIPQGMVRGSMLELMDHTFDGHEDSVTGDLRAGLGQLIDGRYGRDNFKAAGKNSVVRGYDWVGWKKRPPAASVNLVFTFDTVRSFSRMDIHTNNHFTKDIQVFNQVSDATKLQPLPLSRLQTDFLSLEDFHKKIDGMENAAHVANKLAFQTTDKERMNSEEATFLMHFFR